MAVYRKKPVDVEMIQWTGDNIAEVAAFVGTIDPPLVTEASFLDDDRPVLGLWVEKSQARCDVRAGGWVVRELDGNGYYPLTEYDQRTGYDEIGSPAVDFDAVMPDERAFGLLAHLMEAGGKIANIDADWLCGWIQRQRS